MSYLKSHLKDIFAILIMLFLVVAKYYNIEGIPDDVMALATGLFFGNRLGSKNNSA